MPWPARCGTGAAKISLDKVYRTIDKVATILGVAMQHQGDGSLG